MDNVIPVELMKHGIEIFGTEERFMGWLEKKNFFFDNKAPIDFISKDKGIKLIDDRLGAIEYGDNA